MPEKGGLAHFCVNIDIMWSVSHWTAKAGGRVFAGNFCKPGSSHNPNDTFLHELFLYTERAFINKG